MNRIVAAVVQAGSCLFDTQRTLDKAATYVEQAAQLAAIPRGLTLVRASAPGPPQAATISADIGRLQLTSLAKKRRCWGRWPRRIASTLLLE